MKVLANIQVLRALAAYAIVVFHIMHAINDRYATGYRFSVGSAGVDVFFVISGFIIVHTTIRGRSAPGAFWLRRVIRVYPIYWLMISVLVVVSLAGYRPIGLMAWDMGDLLTSLALFPDIRADSQKTPLLGLAWTLVHEVFFYFVFGSVLFLRRPFHRVSAVTLVFGALVAWHFAYRPEPFWLARYTDPICLEFCVGCWLALAYAALPQGLPPQLQRLGTSVLVAVVTAFCALGVLPWDTRAWRVVAFGVPAALLVAAALLMERGGRSWSAGPLLLQGNASYAIYLSHPFVVFAVFQGVDRLRPDAAVPLLVTAGGVSLVLAGIVGTALHRRVEIPLNRALRQVMMRD